MKKHFSFARDKETGQIHTEPFSISKDSNETVIVFESQPNKVYPVKQFIFKDVFVSTSDGAFLNLIESFLEANCEITQSGRDYIPTVVFITEFKQWLKENKMLLVSNKYIYSKMQELGFKKRKKRVLSGNRNCFLGVRFKTNWR